MHDVVRAPFSASRVPNGTIENSPAKVSAIFAEPVLGNPFAQMSLAGRQPGQRLPTAISPKATRSPRHPSQADSLSYSGFMAPPSQTIITITSRPRPCRRLWLFVLLLLPIAWYLGRREWDLNASYSGVVVEKGMDYSLFSHARTPDLYIVLRDDHGKRSKRYVCARICSTSEMTRWSDLAIGAFVVKDGAYGEFPHAPGDKPNAPPASTSSGHTWLFLGLLLVCAALMFNSLRQLWRALRDAFG